MKNFTIHNQDYSDIFVAFNDLGIDIETVGMKYIYYHRYGDYEYLLIKLGIYDNCILKSGSFFDKQKILEKINCTSDKLKETSVYVDYIVKNNKDFLNRICCVIGLWEQSLLIE